MKIFVTDCKQLKFPKNYFLEKLENQDKNASYSYCIFKCR